MTSNSCVSFIWIRWEFEVGGCKLLLCSIVGGRTSAIEDSG